MEGCKEEERNSGGDEARLSTFPIAFADSAKGTAWFIPARTALANRDFACVDNPGYTLDIDTLRIGPGTFAQGLGLEPEA